MRSVVRLSIPILMEMGRKGYEGDWEEDKKHGVSSPLLVGSFMKGIEGMVK